MVRWTRHRRCWPCAAGPAATAGMTRSWLDGSGSLRQALSCFAGSLVPSGCLIVDVEPPRLQARTGPAAELQPFRLQYWSLGEFGQLLAGAGFTGISVSADYRDDRTPGPDSDIWTCCAARA